jgi:macrolide transport system ATP-binding/permease protein
VVTHDPRVARYADRRIQMLDGRVSEDTGAARRRDPLPPLDYPNRARWWPSIAQISQIVRTASRSLRCNPLRTMLTLLGIVIGVASFVTMLAIGEGAKQKLASKIDELGANLLIVTPNRSDFSGAMLTLADVDEIPRNLDNVRSILPEASEQAVARHGNQDYKVAVTATVADYPLARGWAVSEGTFFTDDDNRTFAPVAVLGASVRERLFPYGEDPLGRYVLIGNVPFLVIGTMSRKGAGAWGPSNRDDSVFVPLKTGFARLFGYQSVGLVSVVVDDSTQIDRTEHALRNLLTERHHRPDVLVISSAEMQANMAHAMRIASLVLAAIGTIALLVGGIGIMNIMLVSVTERTREIGIRMATGARRFDILVQFLLEALLLCLIGGALGTLSGYALGEVIATIAPAISVSFTGTPAILALTCAVTTGLVFGYLPARRAARLDPGVALAYG